MTGYSPDPGDLGGRLPPDPARRRRPRAEDDAGLAPHARFAAWDGRQHVPDLDADEILAALADDVMAEGDLGEALRRLMERGWRGQDPTRPDLAGLEDLR